MTVHKSVESGLHGAPWGCLISATHDICYPCEHGRAVIWNAEVIRKLVSIYAPSPIGNQPLGVLCELVNDNVLEPWRSVMIAGAFADR